MKSILKRIFMFSTSYNYNNLSRLFIRFFVGIMFMQFGIRQLLGFNEIAGLFPAVFGMSSESTLILMIIIELVPSVMIMVGFLTRLATIPAILSMIVGANYLLTDIAHQMPYNMSYYQPGYLPMMFIGMFLYILLAGPGKISLDYLISLHLVNRECSYNDYEKLNKA